jgi:6-phosphogluconolactonase
MIIRGNRKSLEKKTGSLLAQMISRFLRKQPTVVFGVPGGRSVTSVLRHLGAEPVEWDRVHLFMVDERLVPPGDPESNYRTVAAAVKPFMKDDNLHPFRFDPASIGTALTAYHRELAGYEGRFDIVLLSSGEDGHVASLFPDHETIRNPAELFIFTSRAPKPPPARMSASRALLQCARAGVLLFLGPEKQDAFCLFSDDTKSVESCPAKLVREIPEHYILVQEDA